MSFRSCSFIKLFLKLYTLKKVNDLNVWILLAFHPSSKSVLISNNHTEFFVIRRESDLVNNASYAKLYFLLNFNVSHVIELSFVYYYLARWSANSNSVSIKRCVNTCYPGIVFKHYSFVGFLFGLGPNTNLPILSSCNEILFVQSSHTLNRPLSWIKNNLLPKLNI